MSCRSCARSTQTDHRRRDRRGGGGCPGGGRDRAPSPASNRPQQPGRGLARAKGLTKIDGQVQVNNPNMLRLMTGLGYNVQPFSEDLNFKLVSKAL